MEILLITSYYPHNFGDTAFIKPEAPFLSNAFKKVHVFCRAHDALRYKNIEMPLNYNLISHKISSSKKYFTASNLSLLFYFFFFKEVFILWKERKINKATLKKAMYYIYHSKQEAIFLNQYISQNPEIKIIYTYWFDIGAMACIIYKKYYNKRMICITRAHGWDLYEFQQEDNYQPYKKWMDKHIDRVFFVSKAGYDYYLRLFAGPLKNKYILARLGIENPYTLQDTANLGTVNGWLNIVSCSFIIPLKRINLIILALSKITDISIKWVHIGNGTERNELENMAKNLLENKVNIIYNFLGNLDNDSVKKYYYENYFDCFLSTTETEGLPVSMMEALSFGIPIIASNVGGVPEIVNNDTGILLDPNNCVEELINALHRFAVMTSAETEALRKSCRKYWENNYMAETQYSQFIKYLKELQN
jgi:glycosyltransferase involved in cell wall biosynthesis